MLYFVFVVTRILVSSINHFLLYISHLTVQRLVELLGYPEDRVVKPALRAVGNIVCAEDEVDYTQLIVQAGVLPHLKKLIKSDNKVYS